MQEQDEIPLSGSNEYSIPQEASFPGDRPLNARGAYNLPGDEMPVGSQLDEKPIGSAGAYNLPPEEAPEEAEAEETGPLEKRIESKAWKTRVKALEELTGLLRTDPDPPFAAYLDLVVKFISDSHAGAQENGLDVLSVYIEKQPDMILSQSEGITKALIEKGIANTKANIKQKSANILLDFYGIHRISQEPFITGLIAALNNKNLKIQAAAVSSTNSIMGAYGAKAFSFKPFVAIMEKFAAVSNPQVRGEALNFYKEAYKWVRDLILPSVDKLKKAQQDELKKSFEELTEPPVITRYIVGQQPKAEESKAGGKSKGAEIDIYDMADAKDIFNKYGERWADGVLAMEKWVEKKAALEELNAELNYPKLAEKSPIALTTMGKRLVNDSNVNVMMQAMKMIGLLAKGQRKYFDSYAKQFLPIFLQKFKDKKSLVIQETHTSLDNLMFSLNIEQVIDDIKEALEDKTPSVKINTCQWLERVFADMANEQVAKVAKLIAVILKKNTDDSTADVRNSCFKMLACLLNKCPDIINPVIKDLPPAKMKKIEDAGGGGGTGKREQSVERTVTVEESKDEKPELRKQRKSLTSAPQQVKPPTSSKKQPLLPPKSPQPQKDKEATAQPEEDLGAPMSADDAEAVISPLIASETFEKLKNTNWKEKQTGLQEFLEWITNNQSVASENNEAIMRFVKSTVKDWKENNFNVNKAAFDLFSYLAQNCNLTKRAASMALNSQALDKFSDMKLIESYNSCIFSFCECVGPRFVVSSIIKNTSDCNKPKVVSECCSTIGKAITDYGIHTVNLKEVIDYAKAGISQTNAVIKKAAQSLTIIIYSHIGDKILPFLSDIKEQTLKVLQEEFSKTEVIKNANYKSVRGEEESKLDPNKMMDAQFPRTNISSQINAAILKKLGDSNWKVRKEGLEAVEAVIDQSGMRILPTGLEVLFKALKARLADPNKSLVRQTLGLMGKLAQALGPEANSISKSIVPGIISNLSDKNSLLRTDALAAVDKWSQEVNPECVINQSAQPLLQENPELRTELLNWLLAHKEHFPKCDMKSMAPSILACLQDRSASIRNAAELLFAETVPLVGFDTFQPLLKDIKPAVMNTLSNIFDKYKGSSNSQPSEADSPRENTLSASSRQSRSQTANTSGSRSNSKGSNRNASKPGSDTPKNEKELLKTPKPSSKAAEQASQDISIIPGPGKDKRLDYEAKHRWSIEELRQDYVDKLRADMKASFSNDLFNLLFSADFKKQIESIQDLSILLTSQRREMQDVIDLVFKFIWFKLLEGNNPQIYKALFEFCAQAISTFQEDNYSLSEGEAMLLLPIMCEKSGHNNAVFRQMIRGIIHTTTKIYPAEKVFLIVLQGLNSKNARSKVECLDELTSLIQEFGSVIAQPRDIRAIAKFVNSPDNNVRTSAVGTIGECFKTMGDRIWNLIGEVPDKVKDLLEQRFKSISGPTNPPASQGSSLKPPLKKKDEESNSKLNTPRGNKLQFKFEENPEVPTFNESEEVEVVVQPKKKPEIAVTPPSQQLATAPNQSSSGRIPTIQNRNVMQSSIDQPIQVLMPDQTPQISAPSQLFKPQVIQPPSSSQIITQFDSPPSKQEQITPRINREEEKKISALDNLVASPEVNINESLLYDPHRAEEAQSELDRHIDTLRSGDMSSRVDALVAINDLILNNLDSHKEEFQKKANMLIDALSKVIISTFERPIEDIPLRFAKYFLNVVHKVCCTKLIMREVSEASLFVLTEQILKRLLIEDLDKLGEKGEGEVMLKTLNGTMLRVLEHCKPTRIFVVLIKLLTKYINETSLSKMPGLIIRCLLKLTKILSTVIHQLEVDRILVAMHEYLVEHKINSSASTDEMGTKTIKTIINELVKLQGEAIWESYAAVRNHSKPDMNIERWISTLLAPATAISSITSPRILKAPQDPILNSIFSRLADDSGYSSAITELFDYVEKNPKSDLTPYLSQIPPDLYNKITEDLRNLKEDKARNEEPQPQALESYNFQDFQNRLAMMKQRYGLAASNQPAQINSTLTDLKAKVNSLLNKTNGQDEQANFISEMKERIQNLNRK